MPTGRNSRKRRAQKRVNPAPKKAKISSPENAQHALLLQKCADKYGLPLQHIQAERLPEALLDLLLNADCDEDNVFHLFRAFVRFTRAGITLNEYPELYSAIMGSAASCSSACAVANFCAFLSKKNISLKENIPLIHAINNHPDNDFIDILKALVLDKVSYNNNPLLHETLFKNPDIPFSCLKGYVPTTIANMDILHSKGIGFDDYPSLYGIILKNPKHGERLSEKFVSASQALIKANIPDEDRKPLLITVSENIALADTLLSTLQTYHTLKITFAGYPQ